MGRTPQTPPEPESKPRQVYVWDIHYAGTKARWLGSVEAENAQAAIAEGARKFRRDPKKLLVVRRG
jgi:hypothetical protein